MPTLKPGTILPSPKENAAITAAAMSDPDAMPLTDAGWKSLVRIPLTLEQRLARFDPERHAGEAMAKAEVGAERW